MMARDIKTTVKAEFGATCVQAPRKLSQGWINASTWHFRATERHVYDDVSWTHQRHVEISIGQLLPSCPADVSGNSLNLECQRRSVCSA